jgi:hypothetical protein
MCGLVGVITKNLNGFNKDQADIFDNLLYIDALRGMDSTGVFLVNKHGEMDLAKEASCASTFRRQPEYRGMLTSAVRDGAAMFGHNRAATKGSIVDANAHPFVVDDNITLIHNGTLWGNHKELADVEVDSHAIAHVIHRNGGDVEKALQELSGAYALIWHNFKERSINFVRNTQRPLHWIETNRGWIWASEGNMIDWILSRYKNLGPVGEVKLLPDSEHISFIQTASGWDIKQEKIVLEKPRTYSNAGWNQSHTRYPYGVDYSDMGGESCLTPEEEDWIKCNRNPTLNQPAPVVLTAPFPRLPSPLTVVQDTPRLKKEEQALAASLGVNMSNAKFMNNSVTIKDDTYKTATCFDFLQVSRDGPSMGYFLYARLKDNPDYLVKLHLPASTSDAELLDLTINNQERVFRLKNRSWTAYHDASHGIGYGLFTAISMIEPIEDVSDATIYKGTVDV